MKAFHLFVFLSVCNTGLTVFIHVCSDIILIFFILYLCYLVGKQVEESLHTKDLTQAEKAFIQTLNLWHILAFETESSNIPAIGFSPSPKLNLIHDDIKYFPVAHTCSKELQIYVSGKNLADDDAFDHCFVVALMNRARCSAVQCQRNRTCASEKKIIKR